MSTDKLHDDDIRAFNPPAVAAAPAAASTPRRRARWPWVLGGAALMLMLVLGVISWAVISGFVHLVDHAVTAGSHDWQVVINGQDWDGLGDFSFDGPLDFFGGALGLVIGAVVLLLVLPITLVFGLGLPLLLAGAGLVLALVLGAGAIALGLTLVLGVFGAPLLLVLGLAWWFVRDSKKRHGV